MLLNINITTQPHALILDFLILFLLDELQLCGLAPTS